MKLLLGQGLPRSTAPILREKHIDATHVGELGMSTASDKSIIEYTRNHSFSIVTLDSDFHASWPLPMQQDHLLLDLRIQPLRAQEAASLTSMVLERFGHEIQQGCLLSVMPTSIRIRRLPISRR
jgi:predicted nuclease of predicted toxin-antitoxin system